MWKLGNRRPSSTLDFNKYIQPGLEPIKSMVTAAEASRHERSCLGRERVKKRERRQKRTVEKRQATSGTRLISNVYQKALHTVDQLSVTLSEIPSSTPIVRRQRTMCIRGLRARLADRSYDISHVHGPR